MMSIAEYPWSPRYLEPHWLKPLQVTRVRRSRKLKIGAGHQGGKDNRKNSVYQIINIFKNVPAVNPFLVIGGGRGDGKVVALVPVPLRIHSVQSKGLDSENIGVNGAFRPGGIDFTGSHIFE